MSSGVSLYADPSQGKRALPPSFPLTMKIEGTACGTDRMTERKRERERGRGINVLSRCSHNHQHLISYRLPLPSNFHRPDYLNVQGAFIIQMYSLKSHRSHCLDYAIMLNKKKTFSMTSTVLDPRRSNTHIFHIQVLRKMFQQDGCTDKLGNVPLICHFHGHSKFSTRRVMFKESFR